ncbi:MAG TPA: peptidyl-prolyl cis-trans isomerase [Gemmatimonadota bacterium]|nr:peptidyl-prolyl cis-trans isomerase [Gemmatimonadota bacterium]
MMQQLRQSTKVIMILVAISFVGLMVFEWGMDLSGVSSGQGGGTSLGSVNGADISIEEYQRQYQVRYEQAQSESPDGRLSPDQLEQIERQAWEDIVDLTLLRREADRRGIGLTDSELVEFIRYNPPPEIVNLPAFQTDGRFDLEKYQRALADPTLAPTWADYEAQLRRTLPIQKLQEQIVAGVTVTDAELLDAYRATNERARIEVLYLDPDRIVPAGSISIPPADIRTYYEEHRDRYRRESSARIRIIQFRPEITAADSAAVEARADSLARAAAQPDTDFAELARTESEDPLTRDSGGDLGWLRPEAMAPAFTEAVRTMAPGEVSAPVLTSFGWHIIKLEDRQSEDGENRIWARHILLPIEPSVEERQTAREAAQSFAQAASAAADREAFARMAAERGLEVTETPLFEEGLVVPGIGVAPAIAGFAFSNDAGSLSGALEMESGHAVVQVIERYPAGTVALEAVEDEIRAELEAEARRAAARELAPGVTEAVRNHGLEEAARSFGLEVRPTDFFTRTNNIPGIGSGTPVAGAAFGLAQGQIAGPIEAPRGLYFLRLLEKQPYDPEAFEEQKAELRDQLRLMQMRAVFNGWFEDLRERADIEDRRAQLLGT